MLPKVFNLNHLNIEIRDLFITINRIPGMHTQTLVKGTYGSIFLHDQ